MASARRVIRAGDWSGPAVDTVLLDYEGRQRRRIALTGIGGTAFLLNLERVMGLRDGDALELDDGRLIAVKAAPEPLHAVHAGDAHALVRIAWHLGNRHLPTAIEGGRLLIRRDHVIADMLRKLGARVAEVTEPFRPEGGAYGMGTPLAHDHAPAPGGQAHGHDHGHGHDHHPAGDHEGHGHG